ncbi:citrate/2-methylcitrate synthase [Staphylococcus aureus]
MGGIENVDAYLDEKFANKDKVMGFGHRVYNGDPKSEIFKRNEPSNFTRKTLVVKNYLKCQ